MESSGLEKTFKVSKSNHQPDQPSPSRYFGQGSPDASHAVLAGWSAIKQPQINLSYFEVICGHSRLGNVSQVVCPPDSGACCPDTLQKKINIHWGQIASSYYIDCMIFGAGTISYGEYVLHLVW